MGCCRYGCSGTGQKRYRNGHRVTVFRHPHDVIFAVPNRVAAAFVQFHAAILHRKCTYPIPTKGVGFTDPLSGTLKRFLATKPLTIRLSPMRAINGMAHTGSSLRRIAEIVIRQAGRAGSAIADNLTGRIATPPAVVGLRGLLRFQGRSDDAVALFVLEHVALALDSGQPGRGARSRSSMAAVNTLSPANAWSQVEKLRFDVMMVELRSYLAATIWKNRCA